MSNDIVFRSSKTLKQFLEANVGRLLEQDTKTLDYLERESSALKNYEEAVARLSAYQYWHDMMNFITGVSTSEPKIPEKLSELNTAWRVWLDVVSSGTAKKSVISSVKQNVVAALKNSVYEKFSIPTDHNNKLKNEKEVFAIKEYEYAKYDPSIIDYSPIDTKPTLASSKSKKSKKTDTPEEKSKLADWNKGSSFENKWVGWPDSSLSIPYGSQKKGKGKFEVGIGPGERRLAFIFGGDVMGSSSTFDLKIDGSNYECKSVDAPSDGIRSGTSGLSAIEEANEELKTVMQQLRQSFDVLYPKYLSTLESESDKHADFIKKCSYIRDWVSKNYDTIVKAGEVSVERFDYLMTCIKVSSSLKNKLAEKTTPKGIDRSIKLSNYNKNITVSDDVYIAIAKKLEQEPGAPQDILENVDVWQIIFSPLQSEAFKDTVSWYKKLVNSIDVNEAFKSSEGVFIVNERKGFYFIPKSDLQNKLKFYQMSQKKPIFRFLDFNSGQSTFESVTK